MKKKVIREKCDVGIIGRSVRISKVRQGVSKSHGRARDMNKMEIKVLEEHHPAGLPARQFLGLAEVHKVFVISEESYQITGALEIVMPMIQGMNNSKELPIIDIVVPFCRGECLREVHTGVKVSVIVFLH